MKFSFILKLCDGQAGKPRHFKYPLNFMWQMLEVSRTIFHSWIGRKKSQYMRRDVELTRLIIRRYRDDYDPPHPLPTL
ncbi:hypothetical protein ACEZDB_18485 [Streptacidiphilus sp. N1-3]|uniref:Uncharacterized protein n=1 Tax=Streptacidiphilus alkalitolerans TaxID=3342712 RepID=A0ABV6X3T8_9ACTN